MYGITRAVRLFDWMKWTIPFVCACACVCSILYLDSIEWRREGRVAYNMVVSCLFVSVHGVSFLALSLSHSFPVSPTRTFLKWRKVYWNPLHCKINRQIKTKYDYTSMKTFPSCRARAECVCVWCWISDVIVMLFSHKVLSVFCDVLSFARFFILHLSFFQSYKR